MHQTTVDAYLEDIVSSAIDRTANAQARREVQQMATIINDAAYEAEQRLLLPLMPSALQLSLCRPHLCVA